MNDKVLIRRNNSNAFKIKKLQTYKPSSVCHSSVE